MNAAPTTETITFNRDEVIDIAADLGVIASYVYDVLDLGDASPDHPSPVAYTRIHDRRRQLLIAAGVLDAEGEPVDEEFEDGQFDEGHRRGEEWFKADFPGLCESFGRRIARAIEFTELASPRSVSTTSGSGTPLRWPADS